MRNAFYVRFSLHEPGPNSGLVGHLHGLLATTVAMETYGQARVDINGIGSGDQIPIELGLSICASTKEDEQDFLKAVDVVLGALQSTVQHYNSNFPVPGGNRIWEVAGALKDVHPNLKQKLLEMEAEHKLPPTKKTNPKDFFKRPENRTH